MTHQHTIDSNNSSDIETPETTIKVILVPDNARLTLTANLFGFFFPMKLEPAQKKGLSNR